MAPAQAGPNVEPTPSAQASDLPRIAVPQLLNDAEQVQLSAPSVDSTQTPLTDSEVGTPDSDDSQVASVTASGDLSSMVTQLRGPDAGSHELECLATGIYFESKSEPLTGQLAVGQVIANRAHSGNRFPPSYCGVLFQRGQFSFVRGHSLPSVSHSSRQWQTAVAIAKIVDQNLKDSVVGNALFFHARYVSPGWHMKRVASIGNHIFYR